METQVSDIAKLNDEFRRHGGSYLLTSGVCALGYTAAVLKAVRQFNSFSEDNDPYGEHDFGSFELLGETLYWKIDYYNPELSGWRDPLDPSCNRVLTVMLSSEY